MTQKLVEALTSNDVEIRREAIAALSKISAVDPPEKLVRDALRRMPASG